MKQITIDGTNFDDLETFYDEVSLKLCPGFDDFGRNYNALIDVLRGGFGFHDYEEPVELVWIDSSKSKRDLGDEFSHILEIIRELDHIRLILK